MRSPGFWAGLWHGGTRRVACPYCGREQRIGRKPLPSDVRCGHCGRMFRLTASGSAQRSE